MSNFKFELGQTVKIRNAAGKLRILARTEYLSGKREYRVRQGILRNWYEEHDLIAVPETTQPEESK